MNDCPFIKQFNVVAGISLISVIITSFLKQIDLMYEDDVDTRRENAISYWPTHKIGQRWPQRV